MKSDKQILELGIDIGSTTVKIVLMDQNGQVLYSDYRRHHAQQILTLCSILEAVRDNYGGYPIHAAVCGSGGKPVAELLHAPYIQEVIATAAAVRKLYPRTETAVELGGQDAKIIFFHHDEKTGRPVVSDMRMNGSCAGGTGAFIDEIAKLLDVNGDELNELALQGEKVYPVSGRCGVFAKTDIQPLLIQGARKQDIALSTFHAIVKQTIGGLAQGLQLKAPILFAGGPLNFYSALRLAFQKHMQLAETDVIVPEHPQLLIAMGACIANRNIHSERKSIDDGVPSMTLDQILRILNGHMKAGRKSESCVSPLFDSEEEYDRFMDRHMPELKDTYELASSDHPQVLNVAIGIDSGSTTSKFVILNEEDRVIYRFYENNLGKPIDVLKARLLEANKYFLQKGYQMRVCSLGTTGYGEHITAAAFGADFHVVETVAHAQASQRYFPKVSFVLDIGGQDMKAIWLDEGIITRIMLNEACSSGCGSFLETFADSLHIRKEDIASSAFRSEHPAALGSRCTVFMNSTVITEQKNGRSPDDIMAGLCRSIIENVFTKVIRISDQSELGQNIVVQGGTFRNMAVLRALEEYLDTEVTLAPYPGEMGAIGAALYAKCRQEQSGRKVSGFIGFEALKTFTYDTVSGVSCSGCENHCLLTIVKFPGGRNWTSGNRCERGSRDDQAFRQKKSVVKNQDYPFFPDEGIAAIREAPDLFQIRKSLLEQDYPISDATAVKKRSIKIGIPRVLEFWDSLPFWTTFFRSMGFTVVLSDLSNRKDFEKGLPFVASDTVCFPAKLIHGHVCNLVEKGVDRIFFPHIMHVLPEGQDKNSPYMCAIVMGYATVVRNSQMPEERYGIPFDTPVFHWFSEHDRKRQICRFAQEYLHVRKKEAAKAFLSGEKAMHTFRSQLQIWGVAAQEYARSRGSFSVVLAGRPYHTDPLVSHEISRRFNKNDIPVLTVDSLPGLNQTRLDHIRPEITNNFHTRMLAGAIQAAEDPDLEYVQIVSFGCGHDAILSDEINRILHENGKSPLILKVDESDAAGALNIRIQSFLETIEMKRGREKHRQEKYQLPNPYPSQFIKKDIHNRKLILPNITEDAMVLIKAVLEKEGYDVVTVPLGGREQIQAGKKYAHNDICFPCQMVIGELITALQDMDVRQENVAVGMVKFQCDCRLSHYAALLRKGMDAAGFEDVPILTTDIGDSKNMHPGVMILGPQGVWEAVWVFMMLDILQSLVRKIRPYEINAGETEALFHESIREIARAVKSGVGSAKEVFKNAINSFKKIQYDRRKLRPRVLVTGELLVTYHPGSNYNIERYLEKCGMETVFPRITDQLRKDFYGQMHQITDFRASIPPYPFLVDGIFDHVQKSLEKIAIAHPLYEKEPRPKDIYKGVSDFMPVTLSCGEGWLMAAEIDHLARDGVRSFVILQPFGCLPNHICGRGVIRKLKERYPNIYILPLDLDPDTSTANIENRLQMLIMESMEK